MNRSSSVAFERIPAGLHSLIQELWDNHVSAEFPLAYLITFTCYGTRLHGDPRGSVDREHNTWGGSYAPSCYSRIQANRRKLAHAPFYLDKQRRCGVLKAVREVCAFRGWIPLALHVRSTHVHSLVNAYDNPDRILKDFKGYSTRELNRIHGRWPKNKWVDKGSRRYLWKPEDVSNAIRYVLFLQGEPMELYIGDKVTPMVAPDSEPGA